MALSNPFQSSLNSATGRFRRAPGACALLALGSLVLAGNALAQTSAMTGASEEQKAIYALGLQMARTVSVFDLSAAELEVLSAGIKDGVQGKPAVSLETYGPQVQPLAVSRQRAKAAKNAELGKVFLDAAAKEPGAVKTTSGLVIVPIKVGSGEQPGVNDTVKVHYRGTLIDGREFDSSYKRSAPAEFPLNGVIPCWTEGVQTMKVGGKARLVCPAGLAYGERGAPGIAGGATLDFEVELLGVTRAARK